MMLFVRLFDRVISSITCYLFKHKWDNDVISFCKRCGKVKFKYKD
jgi:hypothetical protein